MGGGASKPSPSTTQPPAAAPVVPRPAAPDAAPASTDDVNPLGGMMEAENPIDAFMSEILPTKYLKLCSIGKGTYGEAFKVKRVSDSKVFAAKVMDFNSVNERDRKYARNEILCLAQTQHFAVVRFEEEYSVDADTVIVVMEFADDGDLQHYIRNRGGALSEQAAGLLFVQLLLAIDHIHRRRMMHRDIKSSNVMLSSGGLLKLGDFGFSQVYDQTVSDLIATTFVGTPYYVAPEMWSGRRYGKKADIWAAGILLYEMLTGRRPFMGDNMVELQTAVMRGDFEKPKCSQPMKDILMRMLTNSHVTRSSALELLSTDVMKAYTNMLQLHIMQNANEGVRRLFGENLADVQEAIALAPTATVRTLQSYESVIFKEQNGVWKQRYLRLSDGDLILSVGAQSKALPLKEIRSVIVTQAVGREYAFALATDRSDSLTFATNTKEERDTWVECILQHIDT